MKRAALGLGLALIASASFARPPGYPAPPGPPPGYRELYERHQADCRTKGAPVIGMTRRELYATCWGQPYRINTVTLADGDREQLVYAYGYVYLVNDVVTAVQTTK